jgi:beta-glucosidase/6-phospho-beta-glucosidase/beta-galactosidase
MNLAPRGRATDFWNRWQEDVALAARLGCRLFRFSVSWARVEPEPGLFDGAALDHYARLAAASRRAGMEPVVTLHHYASPPHLEGSGGMIGPSFPRLFRRYVERVIEAMGGEVRIWVTFNEPTVLVYGYVKPWWLRDYQMPPGLPADVEDPAEMQARALERLMPNLFRANAEARRAIRERLPDAQVGANPLILGIPPWLRALLDRAATGWDSPHNLHRHVHRLNRRPGPDLGPVTRWLEPVLRRWSALSTALNGNWWHLGQAGRLPEMVCPKDCVGQQDYVGFDYYWGVNGIGPRQLYELSEVAARVFDRAPVWPGGLYSAMRHLDRLFPGQPQMVVENGCVDRAGRTDRATYLRLHVAQVDRALRAGVNVVGYICWSITSNREWGLRFGPGNDFGLYHIDLDTDPELTRRPTAAGALYAELIRERAGVRDREARS